MLFMFLRIHIESKKLANFGTKYETMRHSNLSPTNIYICMLIIYVNIYVLIKQMRTRL